MLRNCAPKVSRASAGTIASMSGRNCAHTHDALSPIALSRVQKQVMEQSGHPRRLPRDSSAALCEALHNAEMLALDIGQALVWASRSSDGSGGSTAGDNWPVSTCQKIDVGSPSHEVRHVMFREQVSVFNE